MHSTITFSKNNLEIERERESSLKECFIYNTIWNWLQVNNFTNLVIASNFHIHVKLLVIYK